MDAAVAETIAKATREEAQQDARADLKELRRLAVEAGRERSRKIIKTTTINTATGVARYNPAGRLLRDWYLHVYLNTLRTNLGEPAVAIDAQQVEDTAGILRRIRGSETIRAIQAAGVVRNIAIDDAAHAATQIVARLRSAGARRAVLHAGNDRFDGDRVRVQVSRHWYQRCYDAHVESGTQSQQPLAAVTDAEEHQVALTLQSRQIRRLIGRDGIPLLTAHNTQMKEIDRRLAAGETGIISPATDSAHHTDPLQTLRRRVTGTWSGLLPSERIYWLQAAGAQQIGQNLGWSDLPGDHQTKIIRFYLDTHRRDLLDEPFDRTLIAAAPEIAARRMFNHPAPLLETTGRGDDTATARSDDQTVSGLSEAVTSPTRQPLNRRTEHP